MKNLMVLLSVMFALAGCGPDRKIVEHIGEEKILIGISGEADVRQVYGVPSMIWEENGKKTLEFATGPEGHRTFMIQIGADDKVLQVRQVLRPGEFIKIVQGMSPADVRKVIGPPGRKIPYDLSGEEMWRYRWIDNGESKFFQVHFDAKQGSPTYAMVKKVTMAPDTETYPTR